MEEQDHKIGRRNDYKADRRDAVRKYLNENPTKTYHEAAEFFGVSRSLIGRYARELGIKRRPIHRRIRERVDLLRFFMGDAEEGGPESPPLDDEILLEVVRKHDELVRSGERTF